MVHHPPQRQKTTALWWGIIAVIHFSSSLASSFVIQPRIWEYKNRHEIGYEVAHSISSRQSTATVITNQTTMDSNMASNFCEEMNRETAVTTKESGTATSVLSKTSDDITPILLLNGFGVGSFHQHRLIPRLLETNSEDVPNQQYRRTIYCVDYLGQGRSWPKDCQDGRSVSEQGLQYSAETWIDQIVTFIEQVILTEQTSNKVHLVGNSVGGHLAAYIAARRPDLVESICLLNPTPVWGLNLPGWSGTLPAPIVPKAIGRFLFDRIRDLKTIEQFLEQTYSRREAFTEELMHQIRGCTLGNGGHAAFASILWSPPLKVTPDSTLKENFQECLSQVPCDVLLVFGKDDPWCKPAFAKKMLQALDQREPHHVHRYIEIENAGHCPNHEAPQAVAHVIRTWIASSNRSKDHLTLVDVGNNGQIIFQEDWGETSISERSVHDINLGMMDRLATTFI
ncbi:alpha/beta fold family hydrolase [Nitzschia inconspicua]|uniref:Alpha/beta fold family hydrolase n=1 Tax=Nitzschia inconspicua TaxID=303405 RepID=A0A9K3LDP8_9STRA|nr:alpha/beta fold family hydrolase [Nitzschia inconspicua]